LRSPIESVGTFATFVFGEMAGDLIALRLGEGSDRVCLRS